MRSKKTFERKNDSTMILPALNGGSQGMSNIFLLKDPTVRKSKPSDTRVFIIVSEYDDTMILVSTEQIEGLGTYDST